MFYRGFMARGRNENRSATVGSTVAKVRKRRRKPGKPYPEFPLYAHAGGVWAKRIRGREHYFGPWSDPEAALQRYLKERDFLFAGQAPPPEVDGCTLDELVNRFLAAQQTKCLSGELTGRALADYKREGKRLLTCLGRTRPADSLHAEDFARLRADAFAGDGKAAGRQRNATTAANIIIRQRSIFKWGYEPAGLLTHPPKYGGAFALPSARLRRRALRANGPKDLTAAEIRALLAAAKAAAHGQLLNLRAMILLGVNCGLGNTDCAELRLAHVADSGGFLDFPRPKTDAPRRAALWPETLEAIQAALKRRAAMIERHGPLPAEVADRLFVTKRRRPYVGLSASGRPMDAVGLEFRRLAASCGLQRRGVGFYGLRHTFQTVADETRDFPAIDLVMGHLPDAGGGASPFAVQMSARYRERISDERLAAVADRVRAWLLSEEGRRHCV
jgi:integrase